MDAGKYVRLKEKGAVTLIKVPGENVMCFVLRYDPETGDQTTPESSIIRKEHLLKMRSDLETSMKSIEAFIADVEAVLKGE